MDKFESYLVGRIKFRLNFRCAEEQEEVVCVLKDPWATLQGMSTGCRKRDGLSCWGITAVVLDGNVD